MLSRVLAQRTIPALVSLGCLIVGSGASGQITDQIGGDFLNPPQDSLRSVDADPPYASQTRLFDESMIDQLRALGQARRGNGAFVFTGSQPEADGHSGCAYGQFGIVVSNRESRNLTVFDTQTRALVRAIPLSGSPQAIGVTPSGVTAVTANLFEGTASIVNLLSGQEEAVIPVGLYPSNVAIDSTGLRAVVSCSGSEEAYVIQIPSRTVERILPTAGTFASFSANFETFAIGFKVWGPKLAGNVLVFPDAEFDRIRLINIVTGSESAIVNVTDPIGVGVDPAGFRACVTSFFPSRTAWYVDPGLGNLIRSIDVGSELMGPACMDFGGTRAVVAIQNNCRIVDFVAQTVGGNLSTASVNDLVPTNQNQYVLGVGFRGSLISFATQTIVKETNNFVSTTVGATHPVLNEAAMFSDTFGEDMVIVNTNGSSGGLISAGPTGPAPEGDKCRTIAVSPDGTRAVAVSMYSQNAAIIELPSAVVVGWVPLGRRAAGVEFTPDGSKAVVANLDSTFASVIDIDAMSVTEVPISRRGGELEISPDGHFAYVAVVADGDGVWRINLDTLAAEGGKLLTGNMGSIGYAYSQISGLTLSHDGGTLVTCNSFDNTASLIETATFTVVKTLAVPGFPVRAMFSHDDSLIYFTTSTSGELAVFTNDGPNSALVGSSPVGVQPLEMALSPDSSKLYVMEFGASRILEVDPGTLGILRDADLSASIVGMALTPDGSRLFVSHGTASATFGGGGFFFTQEGFLSTIDPASFTVVDSYPSHRAPAMLARSAAAGIIATAELWGDGATMFIFDEGGCAADLDGNGVLNIFDFLAFQTLFANDDPAADFAAPFGVFNIFDFLGFQTAFGNGC